MCNFKQLRAKHVYIGLVRRKLLFQLRPTLVMFLAQGSQYWAWLQCCTSAWSIASLDFFFFGLSILKLIRAWSCTQQVRSVITSSCSCSCFLYSKAVRNTVTCSVGWLPHVLYINYPHKVVHWCPLATHHLSFVFHVSLLVYMLSLNVVVFPRPTTGRSRLHRTCGSHSLVVWHRTLPPLNADWLMLTYNVCIHVTGFRFLLKIWTELAQLWSWLQQYS